MEGPSPVPSRSMLGFGDTDCCCCTIGGGGSGGGGTATSTFLTVSMSGSRTGAIFTAKMSINNPKVSKMLKAHGRTRTARPFLFNDAMPCSAGCKLFICRCNIDAFDTGELRLVDHFYQ